MATIQNARDVLLQAAATRLETVAGPTNVTTDFANVTGSTRPSNNADVTQAAVNSGVTATGGGITLSSGGAIKGGQTAYDSGNGFFLGYTGSAYKFSVGNSSGNKFTWNGSTLGIVGDITGTSNIEITGNARFRGAYTGAVTNAAVYSNESNTAATGVFGTSSATLASHAATGIGVWGVGTGTEAFGVVGNATGGIGVSGATASSSNAGVRGNNTGGGPSIECVTTFKWNGYTYSVPAGSSTTCMHNDGVWRDPVTTARVNAAFGASESDVLQLIVTDSGTATVGGSGINLTSTIAGVRFRATGSNNIVLETF
jgi:predicted secreted protein